MTKRDDPRTPEEILRAEAEAEKQRDQLYQESKHQVVNRCPDCGGLGSMEMIDGVLRCIDCDLEVAAVSQLSGFGRR